MQIASVAVAPLASRYERPGARRGAPRSVLTGRGWLRAAVGEDAIISARAHATAQLQLPANVTRRLVMPRSAAALVEAETLAPVPDADLPADEVPRGHGIVHSAAFGTTALRWRHASLECRSVPRAHTLPLRSRREPRRRAAGERDPGTLRGTLVSCIVRRRCCAQGGIQSLVVQTGARQPADGAAVPSQDVEEARAPAKEKGDAARQPTGKSLIGRSLFLFGPQNPLRCAHVRARARAQPRACWRVVVTRRRRRRRPSLGCWQAVHVPLAEASLV
jgi:hypothetical protein